MGYASLTDLASAGLPAAALASISNGDKQAALDDMSAYADSYMGDKYQLPLSAPYDRSLVRVVCWLAAWDLLTLRGYNPSDPTDAMVERRKDMAIDFLTRVANGQARLNVVQSAPESLQPDVSSDCGRGYGSGSTVGPDWGE